MRILVFLLFLSGSVVAQAQHDWGVGLILANPTGFSVKHKFSSKNSIDGALGYSLGRRDYFHLHSTYLWNFDRGLPVGSIALGYYFGVGGALYSWDRYDNPPPWAENTDDELGLAIRGSGGINYVFNDPRFEIFAELALHFFFVPETDVDLGIALGGRFYF